MTIATKNLSQGKTTHDAVIDVSTSLPHAEAQATGDSGAETELPEVAYSSEVVEDIREQLLAREEMRLTSPVSSESEGQKRKMDKTKHGEGMEGEKVVEKERRGDNKSVMPAEKGENRKVTGEETTEPQSNKKRTDAGPTESSVQVSLVAMNSLVSMMQTHKAQLERNETGNEKVENAMGEVTCMLSKVADALYRLKNVVEDSAKKERKREEKRVEMERRREEERRKDREEERKRDERRWEADRKDRQEKKTFAGR